MDFYYTIYYTTIIYTIYVRKEDIYYCVTTALYVIHMQYINCFALQQSIITLMFHFLYLQELLFWHEHSETCCATDFILISLKYAHYGVSTQCGVSTPLLELLQLQTI